MQEMASAPDLDALCTPTAVRGYMELCARHLPKKAEALKQCLIDQISERPGLLLPLDEAPSNPHLAQLHAALHSHRQQIARQRETVLTALTEAGVDVMIIKGINLEAHYPEGLLRRSNDMDLVVRDYSAFWRMSEALEALGYWPYGVSYARDPWDGIIEHGFGQFAPPNENEPELEVSYGGFSETLAGAPTSWLWEHSVQHDTGTVRYRTLDHVGKLVLLLIEVYSRPQVTGRDVFDFYLLTHDISSEMRERILEAVRGFSLDIIFARLSRQLFRYMKAETPQWLRDLPRGALGEWPWMLRRNLFCVLPFLLRRTDAWTAWKKAIGQYVDEYWNALSIRGWTGFVRLRDLWHTPAKRFAKGRYVILVLVSSGMRGELKWNRIGRYIFLRTPVGVYLASTHSFETESELDKAGTAYTLATTGHTGKL